MKSRIKTIIVGLICFIGGLTFITYAGSYNSEEISYDNSTSHASETNVKDAIDYLYSHGSCGEGMSCLESPTVSITIDGNGIVDSNSIKIPINGSNKITLEPDDGYYLYSINCSEGYTIGEYNTLINSTTELSSKRQEIEITNTRQFDDGTCTISFKEGYTTVTLNVSGNGNVESSSIYVPIDGNTEVQTTPNNGYYLHSITCTDGYDSTYNGMDNSTNALSSQSQQIVITNNHKLENGTCNLTFGTNEISVSSTQLHLTNKYDFCNSESSGCVCYYIHKYVKGYNSSSNRGQEFSYNRHNGCKFKSYDCHYYPGYNNGLSFNCAILSWSDFNYWIGSSSGSNYGYGAACSGVITCAT